MKVVASLGGEIGERCLGVAVCPKLLCRTMWLFEKEKF